MGRNEYRWAATAFKGGVNQSVDAGASLDECADCLNVWAPKGRVETRPGYVGVGNRLPVLDASTTATVFKARKEDNSGATPSYTSPSGAGALTLGNLVKNRDRWYLGHSSTFNNAKVVVTTANTAAGAFAVVSYWDGSEWRGLQAGEYTVAGERGHLASTSAMVLTFAAPQDWATTTVDGQSAYWLRFDIRGANLAGNPAIDVDDVNTGIVGEADVRGLFVTQFPQIRRYVSVVTYDDSGTFTVQHDDTSGGFTIIDGDSMGNTSLTGDGLKQNVPATCAVVPQFSESFVAYSGRVVRHRPPPDVDPVEAAVEKGDFATGPAAPYDKDLVAQLGTWPRCNITVFFGGRLWAMGIAGEPYRVRWSAAQPYHKVWPELSYEDLMEDDNSPITAAHPLGEHLVVFKQDSIWVMIPVGENPATGVESFVPKRIVAGVGCVANGSIKNIRGRLIFLSEDGVYAFDGTPNIVKVSEKRGEDRVCDTIASISPARRAHASAAHWKTKSHYLLSFSTGGEEHDTTIAWDYAQDTWWLWDNIDARHWVEGENGTDDEALFFGDSQGQVFEFGVGRTDHGGTIDSHITTQRMGSQDGSRRVLRCVRALATNRTGTATVSIYPDDDPTPETSTMTFTDTLDVVERRRLRRSDVRVFFDWVQVKFSHAVKNARMSLSRLELGFIQMGRRK